MKGFRRYLVPLACVALLGLAAQLAAPALARADAGDGRAVRVMLYTACALGIAGAITPFGLAGAIIACGVLFVRED